MIENINHENMFMRGNGIFIKETYNLGTQKLTGYFRFFNILLYIYASF